MIDEIKLQGMLNNSRRTSWNRRHHLGWPIRAVDVVINRDFDDNNDAITATDYENARARGGHLLALVHDGYCFSKPRLARLRPNFKSGIIEAYLPDGTEFCYCRLNVDEWFGSLIGLQNGE